MKSIIFTGLLLVCLLSGGCVPSQNFDARLNSIVEPYLFSIADWELRTIQQEMGQWLFGSEEEIDDEVQVVTEYFTSIKQIKALKSEMAAVNAGNGESTLPPLEDELRSLLERKVVLAGMEELPCLLVISPRDRIDSVREIVLKQSLILAEKEAIEAKVDGLGVSSLVVGLGGMATYPALVDSEASLRSTIDTITGFLLFYT